MIGKCSRDYKDCSPLNRTYKSKAFICIGLQDKQKPDEFTICHNDKKTGKRYAIDRDDLISADTVIMNALYPTKSRIK